MNLIGKLKESRKLKGMNIDEELKRIEEKMKKNDPESETYKMLQNAQEQALKNKKLVKDMKCFGIPPEKIMYALLIFLIAVFGFSLDLDSPKSLKIAQFVVNLVKKA